MNQGVTFNHGQWGFKRITSSDGDVSADDGSFYSLKAIGGEVTFGPNMEVKEGDAPAEDDVLLEGDSLSGVFTTVDIKNATTGVVYAYYIKEQ